MVPTQTSAYTTRKTSAIPIKLFIETPYGLRVGAVVGGRTLRRFGSGRGLWSRPGEPEGWAFRQDLLDRAAELGVTPIVAAP